MGPCATATKHRASPMPNAHEAKKIEEDQGGRVGNPYMREVGGEEKKRVKTRQR